MFKVLQMFGHVLLDGADRQKENQQHDACPKETPIRRVYNGSFNKDRVKQSRNRDRIRIFSFGIRSSEYRSLVLL